MPELTSLKVPPRVRDQFAHAAQLRGTTVRALLAQLAREAERAAMMDEARYALEKMRDERPELWAGYVDEGDLVMSGLDEPVHD